MIRTGLLTLALALLAAAPASAAFDVTAFDVTPSSTAAGAHADVMIATSFTPYPLLGTPPERPRNLVFHLPAGLAGDPFATPRCSEADYRADACGPATKVGVASARATVPPALAQDVTGDLYNLAPAGAEPARLGAVLRPSLPPGATKIFSPSTIVVRPADGGLDSVITDLPMTQDGVPIYTERLTFTLQGQPAGAARPFMRNPTSCHPATTVVDATSYDPATTVSKSSSFTPTACGALPFQPHIEASIGARGLTAHRAHPPVTTVVSQASEQASQASVTVGLPPVVGVDLAQLSRACPAGLLAAHTCPPTSKVGTVTAATPLLATPLTGDVFLTQKGVGAQPGLTIQLHDPIPLRLDGSVEITAQGLKTTFTGLPDVPLARFQLDLAGGASSVFLLSSDLCAAKPPAISAAFAAHSGAQSSETKPMVVAGCTPAPRATARITRLKSGRPTVQLTLKAGSAGSPALRSVRLVFPAALDTHPKRARKGVRVKAGGKTLARKAIRLTNQGDLRLALPAGTRTVTATLSKGAVTASRKLKRARRPKAQTLQLLVTDQDGERPPARLKVKPKR